MKFSVDANIFRKAIDLVTSIKGGPVRLDLHDGLLEITGMTPWCNVIRTIETGVDGDVSFTMNTLKVKSWLRGVAPGNLVIEVTEDGAGGHMLKMTQLPHSYVFRTMDERYLTKMVLPEEDHVYDIPAVLLLEGLKETAHAIKAGRSPLGDPAVYEAQHVQFYSDEKLRICAIDPSRGIAIRGALDEHYDNGADILIPVILTGPIRAFDPEDTVHVVIGKDRFMLSTKDITIISTKHSVKFKLPAFLFYKPECPPVYVDKNMLADALYFASIASTMCDLKVDGDMMMVCPHGFIEGVDKEVRGDPTQVEGGTLLSCSSEEHDTVTVMASYLKTVMDSIMSDEVRMFFTKINGKPAPMIISGDGYTECVAIMKAMG